MVTVAGLAETAALIGDPARAAMLVALLDGRAYTAGELARTGGVSAPTASGHLARLLDAGMVAVERQGRHRYFRIASAEIGAGIEALLAVTASRRETQLARPLLVGPRDPVLRRARICYDHLAGELGVALFQAMVARDHVRLAAGGAELTGDGERFLTGLGIVPDGSRAAACRPCLDWSERRHHLAGRVGAAICTAALERGWVRRGDGTRALRITPGGAAALEKGFGLRLNG